MPVLDEKGLAPLANIQQIVTGQFRTCALVKVGNTNEARCWGLNTSGALGNGGTAAESTLPTPVCLTGSVGANSCVAAGNLAEIATGDSHTCARFNGGAMACWGANFIGQLGLVAGGAFTKDNLAHPNPVFVKDPANVAANLQVNRIATAIGETGDSTCAIRKSDQAVLCWGTNFKGQLGRNSLTTTLAGQETPSPVCASNMGCPPLTGVSDLGVGYGHACAIVADKVRCWGWNNRGQLGDQTFTDKAFAGFEVPTAERASQVAVGEFHTCARLLDGRVQCWGIGGSLGSGETDDVPTPTFPKW
jgi:alpha-tubulin suppressor-like RCC1 family protein